MAELQLTTLGRTDLTAADGGAILSVLAQPKRFALLVHLAIEASDGFVRRDSVATLFWPENDQTDARANLRKSLYFLRKSLGDGVVVARGDEEIGVDGSRLSCDVVRVLSGEGTSADGPFLDGFHFSGASNEWEDWLETVRSRVHASVPAEVVESGPGPAADATGVPVESLASAPTPDRGRARRMTIRAAAAIAILLVAGWGVDMLLSGGGGSAPTRYDRIRLGTGAQHPTVVQRHYALPPDGAGILFRDDVDGVPGSWWKAVDAVEASYIDGLDDISGPAFSPDGGWVAFARDGQLMKQELAGPAPIVLTDSVSEDYSPGIAWLPNGDILFEDRDHNLRVSRAAGGPAEIVATMEQVGQVFHVSAMPDGRGALVTGCETSCDATVTPQLSLVEFDDGRVARLRSGVWMAWPMDDGRIVMVDPAGTVSAAELDRTAATLGHPVPLLDGVRMSPVPDLAMGRDGSLLYIAGGAEPYGERLMWVDRNGVSAVADPDWPPGGNTRSMSLSPDDDRLAVGINPVGPPPERIWIKDFSSGLLTPLTEPSIEARRPVWGPDGKRIAFILQTEIGDGRLSGTVHGLPVDASTTEPTNLLDHDRMILEVAMTGDWETAVVRLGNAGDGAGDIAFTSLMPDAAWQALVRSEANEYGIALSPDGRWLAYVSELGGRPEVYVRPFPGPGPRVQVSRQGGVEPRWAHSGHEIFFRSPEPDAPPGGDTRAMMSASVSVDPAFVVESVDELFSTTGYAVGNRAPLYDVTSDDERFLMVTRFTPRGWTTGEVVYSNGWYWSDQIQARLGR